MKTWIIGISLMLVSGIANAACNTGSLDGTSKVFFSIADSDSLSWQRCTLVVAKKGVIATSSVCTSNEGTEQTVSSGNFTIASSCSMTGEIVLGSDTLTIVDGQITRNKFNFSGVGLTTEGLFTFDGIVQ
ncbi:MAG: hypothetical protein HY356_09040 [Gammaproteobacteria bacterium]|nr:hypothetical protein [Gammaproteobacteria bacterium]